MRATRRWAAAAAIAAAATTWSAATAGAAAPPASLMVTPSTGLRDGQNVEVVFKGVVGTYTVSETVAQCVSRDAADYQNDPSKDCQNVTYVPVGVVPGVGSGEATLTVKATDLKGNPCNNTNNVCTINVRPDFQTYVGSVDIAIAFANAGGAPPQRVTSHHGGSSSTSWGVAAATIAVLGAVALALRRRRRSVNATRERSPV